jgi:hypothetical protein
MTTISPAPKTTVLRPDDLLLLDFEFINLNLETGDAKGAKLVPVSGKQAYIVVHFPPQNIAEEAFFETRPAIESDPDFPKPSKPSYVPDDEKPASPEKIESLPVQSRMSGPSRLVFEIPEGIQEIPYTIPGLLNWVGYTQRVAPTALPPDEVGNRPAIQDPSSLDPPVTTLELPYRLIISPNKTAGWAHSTDLVTHKGRTELWHTRLGVVSYCSSGVSWLGPHVWDVKEGDNQKTKTVRAIWSPDYNPNNPPETNKPEFGVDVPFRMSLNPFDRHQIVRLSSDYRIYNQELNSFYKPEPVNVENLMLSSLGAWMNARGVWPDPPDEKLKKTLRTEQGLIVSEWKHQASQGRDQYVRVVYQGCLFPFGHKATLIKITERKVADINIKDMDGKPKDYTIAYLSQRMYIVVRQPEMNYPDDCYNKDKITNGKDNPFRHSIKITTLMTPDLWPPDYIDSIGAFWVKVKVNGTSTLFPFHIIVMDEEGQSSEFTANLIFIPIDKCATWDVVMPKIQAEYKKDEDSRVCNLHGQKVAFAKRNADKDGDTTLITEELYFDVKQSAQGSISYVPILDTASIRIPAVEQLLGTDNATSIKLASKYIEGDGVLGERDNLGGVFAELTDKPRLSVPPDKAGGLAAPNMDVTGLSQHLGPVAGILEDLNKGEFNPMTFFPDDAKLLGVIKIKDIIEAVASGAFDENLFKSRFPKITSKRNPTSVITTLDWSTKVKKCDPFLPNIDNETKLDIHSTIEKKLDGSEPSYHVNGNLNDFDINFAGAIGVGFKSLSFVAKKGEKLDVNAEIKKVLFLGPLEFVNILSQYLPSSSSSLSPGFSDPPSLDVTSEGVTVGYTMGLPPIAVGVFSLQNISLSAGLSLPFVDKPANLSFAFSERHHPFLLTVSLFAGGGFFGIVLRPDGIQMIEAALEFGGNISIDIGVASGGVYVMAGIYFKYDDTASDPKVTLTGYFRCGGGLEVLGIISISVEFYLGLSYGPNNKVWGQATLTVKVEVLFFSKSVDLTVEKTFAGSGNDPTFGDLVSTQKDWTEYAEAFA